MMKSFLSRLVSRLDIDSGKTRVGLVTYATNVETGFNLSAHYSVAAVQSAISALSYSGGNTDTAAALAHVRRSMLTSAAGDRNNVSNVVVILTDGRSDDKSATQVCTSLFKKPRMSALQKCMVEIATRVVPVFGLAHGLQS